MGMKPLRIRWAGSAEEDLDRLLAFIAAEDPAAARRLWARLMEALDHAAWHPEMAPALEGVGTNYRDLLAVRPFRLVTRVEPRTLWVVAVLRQEQDFDPGRFLQ